MTQNPPDQLLRPEPSGRILGPDGKEFDIPPEGTLGILALGAVGLLAWRQRRGKITSSFVKIEPKRPAGAAKQKRKKRHGDPPGASPAAVPPGKDADGPPAG